MYRIEHQLLETSVVQYSADCTGHILCAYYSNVQTWIPYLVSGSLSFEDGQVKDVCRNPQSKKNVNDSFILFDKRISRIQRQTF